MRTRHMLQALTLVALWLPSSSAEAWLTGGADAGPRIPLALDAADAVYVAETEQGRFLVKKLDPDTGMVIWSTLVDDNDALHAYPFGLDAAGDVIASTGLACDQFTVCTDAAVVKVGGAAGNVVWRKDFVGSGAIALPDGAGDVLVLTDGGASGVVQKVPGAGGPFVWTSAALPFTDAALAIHPSGDAIVAGREVGQELNVARIDGATGAIVWQVGLGLDVFGYLVTADSTGAIVLAVALATAPLQQSVLELDQVDGSVTWQVTEAGAGYKQLATDANDDVFVQAHLELTKHSGASGAELWSASGDSVFALRDDGDVVALNQVGRMRRYDGATGTPLWEQVVLISNSVPFFAALDSLAVGQRAVIGTGQAQGVDGSSDMVFGLAARLTGRAVTMKDTPAAPGERQVLVQSRDPLFAPPAPTGHAGNPTGGGASLTLVNPTTLESGSVSLPAANWSERTSSKFGRYTYKYSDPAGSDPFCKALLKSPGKFKVKCRGTTGGFTLDEASQGSLRAELTIGTGGYPYCLEFGGDVTVDVGSGGTGRGLFKARNAPAASQCTGAF